MAIVFADHSVVCLNSSVTAERSGQLAPRGRPPSDVPVLDLTRVLRGRVAVEGMNEHCSCRGGRGPSPSMNTQPFVLRRTSVRLAWLCGRPALWHLDGTLDRRRSLLHREDTTMQWLRSATRTNQTSDSSRSAEAHLRQGSLSAPSMHLTARCSTSQLSSPRNSSADTTVFVSKTTRTMAGCAPT